MGCVVQFNYAQWVMRYPEFSPRVPPALAQDYFTEATLYQRNDGTGPINDPASALLLLNMLTAHIAELNAPKGDGEQASPLAGRISSAGQGSVNVATEYPVEPGSQAWFVQTRYGAAWWQATASLRSMRYRAGPRRRFNPFPFG